MRILVLPFFNPDFSFTVIARRKPSGVRRTTKQPTNGSSLIPMKNKNTA